jgi:hypothetical protein
MDCVGFLARSRRVQIGVVNDMLMIASLLACVIRLLSTIVVLVLLRHICALALNLNRCSLYWYNVSCVSKQRVGCLIHGCNSFVRCCTTLTRILGNASLVEES